MRLQVSGHLGIIGENFFNLIFFYRWHFASFFLLSTTLHYMRSISLFIDRYLDPQNTEAPFSQEAVQNMPVDLYIGGLGTLIFG
jgi:hypothetical protein